MICPTCNAILQIGDWPWCPHGRGTYTAIADEIPGGQVIENLGPEPVTVYSESQRRRIMKERGLREFVRHVPGSQETSNWSAVCRTTLDNAKSLVDPDRRLRRHAAGEHAAADAPVVGTEQGVDAQDPAAAVSATLATFTFTVREREDGFRVRPDGEPHGRENS